MANGNMQGMGMMAPPAQPMQKQASTPVVDMNSFQQSFSNLSDSLLFFFDIIKAISFFSL